MMQPSVSFSIGASYFRNCSFVQWTFSAPRSRPGFTKFVPALACHFFPTFPAVFSQLRNGKSARSWTPHALSHVLGIPWSQGVWKLAISIPVMVGIKMGGLCLLAPSLCQCRADPYLSHVRREGKKYSSKIPPIPNKALLKHSSKKGARCFS